MLAALAGAALGSSRIDALLEERTACETDAADRQEGKPAQQADYYGAAAAAYEGKRGDRPPDFYWGEDMVAWNDVALQLPPGRVLSGYPHGPTNLPMYGGRAAGNARGGILLPSGATAGACARPGTHRRARY